MICSLATLLDDDDDGALDIEGGGGDCGIIGTDADADDEDGGDVGIVAPLLVVAELL